MPWRSILKSVHQLPALQSCLPTLHNQYLTGDVVFMSSYALGRSPALWEDASDFRPVRTESCLHLLTLHAAVSASSFVLDCGKLDDVDCSFLGAMLPSDGSCGCSSLQVRFYDEARAAQQHRYQFLPFGAGPRMCLGAGFAQVSAMLCSFGWTKTTAHACAFC